MIHSLTASLMSVRYSLRRRESRVPTQPTAGRKPCQTQLEVSHFKFRLIKFTGIAYRYTRDSIGIQTSPPQQAPR